MIYYFESLRAKKQFSKSLNPLILNGYSEKLKCLLSINLTHWYKKDAFIRTLLAFLWPFVVFFMFFVYIFSYFESMTQLTCIVHYVPLGYERLSCISWVRHFAMSAIYCSNKFLSNCQMASEEKWTWASFTVQTKPFSTWPLYPITRSSHLCTRIKFLLEVLHWGTTVSVAGLTIFGKPEPVKRVSVQVVGFVKDYCIKGRANPISCVVGLR